MQKMNMRFVGFVWMSAWTISITGVLMMLMIVYAFGYARMVSYVNAPSSNGGFDKNAELYRHGVHQDRTINIFLGITAVLLAAGMY